MNDTPQFNMVDAQEHYDKWPHPTGIAPMQLAMGAGQDDYPDAYDAVWPAIRSDIQRAFGHKEHDELCRFLYNLYRFAKGKTRPYRWMFWRLPDAPKARRRAGEPLKQLWWFEEQFEWEDFVKYSDGVAVDSPEGEKRGARNFSRLRRLLACGSDGVVGEWDWLKGVESSNSEVPF